jgi:hypothetical protein
VTVLADGIKVDGPLSRAMLETKKKIERRSARSTSGASCLAEAYAKAGPNRPHLKIAQCFSTGLTVRSGPPESGRDDRRAHFSRRSFRPCRDSIVLTRKIPALKRWAIVGKKKSSDGALARLAIRGLPQRHDGVPSPILIRDIRVIRGLRKSTIDNRKSP